MGRGTYSNVFITDIDRMKRANNGHERVSIIEFNPHNVTK